jgi:hypothetical protein
MQILASCRNGVFRSTFVINSFIGVKSPFLVASNNSSPFSIVSSKPRLVIFFLQIGHVKSNLASALRSNRTFNALETDSDTDTMGYQACIDYLETVADIDIRNDYNQTYQELQTAETILLSLIELYK